MVCYYKAWVWGYYYTAWLTIICTCILSHIWMLLPVYDLAYWHFSKNPEIERSLIHTILILIILNFLITQMQFHQTRCLNLYNIGIPVNVLVQYWIVTCSMFSWFCLPFLHYKETPIHPKQNGSATFFQLPCIQPLLHASGNTEQFLEP